MNFIEKGKHAIGKIFPVISTVLGVYAIAWTVFPNEVTKYTIEIPINAFLMLFKKSPKSIHTGNWTLILQCVFIFGMCSCYYLHTLKKYVKKVIDSKVADFNQEKSDEQVYIMRKILYSEERDLFDDNTQKLSSFETIKLILSLIKKYLHNPPQREKVDSHVQSDYYVYTLAASHRNLELKTMSFFLAQVVKKIISEKGYDKVDNGVCNLPVLIVPQDRNVLLAEAVTHRIELYKTQTVAGFSIPILAYQPERGHDDQKNDKYDEHFEYGELFYRIYLGCDALRDKLLKCAGYCATLKESCRKILIHCILVDCNVTRAHAMARMIKDGTGEDENDRIGDLRLKGGFCAIANHEKVKKMLANDLKQGWTVEFDEVHDCATLFVASEQALFNSTTKSLPNVFKDNKLRLWCYLVLPEEIKKALFEMRGELSDEVIKEWLVGKKYNFNKKSKKEFPDLVQKKWKNGWIKSDAKSMDDLIQHFDFWDNQTRKGSGGGV